MPQSSIHSFIHTRRPTNSSIATQQRPFEYECVYERCYGAMLNWMNYISHRMRGARFAYHLTHFSSLAVCRRTAKFSECDRLWFYFLCWLLDEWLSPRKIWFNRKVFWDIHNKFVRVCVRLIRMTSTSIWRQTKRTVTIGIGSAMSAEK